MFDVIATRPDGTEHLVGTVDRDDVDALLASLRAVWAPRWRFSSRPAPRP